MNPESVTNAVTKISRDPAQVTKVTGRNSSQADSGHSLARSATAFAREERTIERLRPFQPYAQFGRISTKGNIHVIKDLDVIAQETDGLKENRFDPFAGD